MRSYWLRIHNVKYDSLGVLLGYFYRFMKYFSVTEEIDILDNVKSDRTFCEKDKHKQMIITLAYNFT